MYTYIFFSQEFIELVREDKRLEAVRYAKKHFSTYEEGQLQDIQHCMGMLAFPKDTGKWGNIGLGVKIKICRSRELQHPQRRH